MKTLHKIIVIALLFNLGINSTSAQIFSSQVPNLPAYDHAPFHFGYGFSIGTISYDITMAPGAYDMVFTGQSRPNKAALSGVRLLDITPMIRPVFQVSYIADLRLTSDLNARLTPSMLLGERRIKYKFAEFDLLDADKIENVFEEDQDLISTFLEIPLSLKYRSKRMHNIAAYVVGGGKFAIDFGALYRKQNQSSTDFIIIPNTYVFSYEVGAGFDIYANYFKLGIEAKMSYSLGDALSEHITPYTMGIASARTKVFLITATFE